MSEVTTGHPHLMDLLMTMHLEHLNESLCLDTEEGLIYLAGTSRWCTDGNFSLAPKQFKQLNVIHVETNRICMTAVYCILKNKYCQCTNIC